MSEDGMGGQGSNMVPEECPVFSRAAAACPTVKSAMTQKTADFAAAPWR